MDFLILLWWTGEYDNPVLESTKDTLASVQNKLPYAVTGGTVAKLISERVNSFKDSMGLTVTDYQTSRMVFC